MRNKNLIALIIGAILLLSFRKPKKRGSVIVDEPTTAKSPDAEFLIKAPNGTELLASDGKKVMGITSGVVYGDGWYSRIYPQFYVFRQFGSNVRYFVYAGTVTRL
jgi:hypothetical protein